MYGALSASSSQTIPYFKKWLKAGYYGSMLWLNRSETTHKRAAIKNLFSWAQTIIVLGWQYTPQRIPLKFLHNPSRGIISRYAFYDDYHQIILEKLNQVGECLEKNYEVKKWKGYVDTGPILEREWGERAGLGFIGQNHTLINPRFGSYFFLAEIIVDKKLVFWPRPQKIKMGCDSCSACLVRCPTKALRKDGIIDARRCIAYLTIEHRGEIPAILRPLIKNRIFGCDICQEVCHYNFHAKQISKKDFPLRPEQILPKLESLLFFSDEEFQRRFKKSPVLRSKREGFMRNVAVALGNWPSKQSYPMLREIIKRDPSPLVREHARWGLMNICGKDKKVV